jgi:hypothetical protein
MKIKLNLVLMLLLGFPAFCQVIPKKANTIIVTNTLTKEQLYNSISNALFEVGYGILNGDKELGQITTTEKSFKTGVVKLNILIKDQKVLIRGDFKMSISINYGSGVTSNPSWSMIENKGMKGSAYQDSWNEMIKITDQIPGTKEYLIK